MALSKRYLVCDLWTARLFPEQEQFGSSRKEQGHESKKQECPIGGPEESDLLGEAVGGLERHFVDTKEVGSKLQRHGTREDRGRQVQG